ncbi:metallopeptidase family protein [Plastorhodobacter daqingensis]|uniref:Metallopeptidase family protein n=1 Tax=Plastorhodobacter daqingensis TaxID=1387281 RepID=A0ABW2UQ22_9RHOB
MTNSWSGITPPSLDDIAELAQEAIDRLPPQYITAARAVLLRVEDFPADEMLDELDLHDPFELTGLYEGVPMTEKSVMDQPHGPDTIWLFRRPILDEWHQRENVLLGDLVAHVFVHELAHHFGWSDAEIARIDQWWAPHPSDS